MITAAPRIITTFRANGCFYLVMERIAGRTLQQIIASHERISTRRMLKYCANMARIVASIHSAGWAWRDCKPANFLCQKNYKLRALDFEGACRLHEANPLKWTTHDYMPPKRGRDMADLEALDLYALGTSIMQVIARSDSPTKLTVAFQREIKKRKLPQRLMEAIRALRSPKAKTRQSARATQQIFQDLLTSPER